MSSEREYYLVLGLMSNLGLVVRLRNAQTAVGSRQFHRNAQDRYRNSHMKNSTDYPGIVRYFRPLRSGQIVDD
jgi:hypothetical protein